VKVTNEGAGARTQDLRIKSPLLYQLSYRVVDQADESIHRAAPAALTAIAGSRHQQVLDHLHERHG
jgi:hypothetical protein